MANGQSHVKLESHAIHGTVIGHWLYAIVGRFPREWKVGFEINSGGKWRFPSGMEYVVGLKQRRQAVSTERKHHKPPH